MQVAVVASLPVLDAAIQQTTILELGRAVYGGAPIITQLIEALANAAPGMFATLTRTERNKLELTTDPEVFAARSLSVRPEGLRVF